MKIGLYILDPEFDKLSLKEIEEAFHMVLGFERGSFSVFEIRDSEGSERKALHFPTDIDDPLMRGYELEVLSSFNSGDEQSSLRSQDSKRVMSKSDSGPKEDFDGVCLPLGLLLLSNRWAPGSTSAGHRRSESCSRAGMLGRTRSSSGGETPQSYEPRSHGARAEAEVARLRERCANLETLAERHRKEIRQAQVQAELRNRQLDALGMVWCTGGCTGGMHRFTDAEVTESMIVDMATNAARAVAWWINRHGKGKPDYAERFARARSALERLVGEKLMDDLAVLQAEVSHLRARTTDRNEKAK